MQDTLDLTDLEFKILKDRLESGSVVDALSSLVNEDDEHCYHPQDVEVIVSCLLNDELEEALSHSDGITHAVLADCVEGSTWMGNADLDWSSQKIAKHEVAMCVLARKVGVFVGRELQPVLN